MSTLHADPEKQRQIRIKIENLTIALLAAFSLFLFIVTFSLFPEFRRQCRFHLKWDAWCSVHFQLSFLPSASNYGKGNAMHGRLPWVFLY